MGRPLYTYFELAGLLPAPFLFPSIYPNNSLNLAKQFPGGKAGGEERSKQCLCDKDRE